MILVELLEKIQLRTLLAGCPLWIADVMHLGVLGLEAGVADGSAAEVRGQKRATPIVQATVREGRTNGHVGRQIFVFRTKPVTNPRAHARPHKIIRTGMQLQQRAAMGGVCAVCAVDKTRCHPHAAPRTGRVR